MPSRRRFLDQMLGVGAVAAVSGSCSTQQPSTGNPRRQIVDAQVHIWKANTPDRPWPTNAGPPQLPEPFSYEKLLALMDEANVDRAILVPPSDTIGPIRQTVLGDDGIARRFLVICPVVDGKPGAVVQTQVL